MFAIAQPTLLCACSLLAVLLFLGVQAWRRRPVRFETSDADLIEEVRLMADADREARYLAPVRVARLAPPDRVRRVHRHF